MKTTVLPANKSFQITLAILLFVMLAGLLSIYLPPAVDWHGAFRPAALEIIHGRSPYNAEGFFNPPWTAILLVPFAVLPENVGRAALVIAALATYAYVAHRFGASKLVIGFLLISPPVLHGILNGNIDWLAVLGVVLPPWIGLFFLMIKPQVGLAVGVYILLISWREGGIIKVVKTFAPSGLALAASIAVFGPWFLAIPPVSEIRLNASFWPLSLPIGLAWLVASVRKTQIRYSLIASPFLSPYMLLHSWVGALLALTPLTYEFIAVVTGLWILVLTRLLL
jgi:hypothetical protein